MYTDSSPFGKRLRDLMARRKVKVLELAEAVNVSKDAVIKWRSGQVPNAAHLKDVARFFGLNMEQMLDKIPANEGDLEKWRKVPLGQVPAHVLQQMGLLGRAERMIAFSQSPNWKEEVRSVVEEMLPHNPLRKKSQMGVDNVRESEYGRAVIGDVKTLMERVKELTAKRGARAALAKELEISPSSLSEWLSGVSAPDGDNTLKLLNWVQKPRQN